MCVCTPGIRTPYCGKPGCERPENGRVRFALTPAKLTITQCDIERMIRDGVREAGYEPKTIRLICQPHQYNGPDAFSAEVEVEPIKTTQQTASSAP